MRCLYCGEPLSLLRKLTGKAEFCSEAHRVAYQDEFNSLALQRLAAQPKMVRRPEPRTFVPPPEPAVPAFFVPDVLDQEQEGVDVPFAGLPFPEDPDDYDFEYEAPVPVTAVAAPVADFGPPPPPLWGLLGEAVSLHPAGQIPPNYGFPLTLADYPRPCVSPNGVFHAPQVGNVPLSGYVDLPEFLDDAPVAVAAQGHLPSPQLLVIPIYDLLALHANQLPSESGLFLLAATESRPESAFAPATPTLALPGYRRPPAASLSAPSLPLPSSIASGTVEWSGPILLEAPPAFEARHEFQTSVRHLEAPSATLALQGVPCAPPAVLLADSPHFLELDLTSISLVDSLAAIPECESFDAERMLISPAFAPVAAATGVPSAELVHLPLLVDSSSAVDPTGAPLAFPSAVCQVASASLSPAPEIPAAAIIASGAPAGVAFSKADAESHPRTLAFPPSAPVPSHAPMAAARRDLALAEAAASLETILDATERTVTAPAPVTFAPTLAFPLSALASSACHLPPEWTWAALPDVPLAMPLLEDELEVPVVALASEPEPEVLPWPLAFPQMRSPLPRTASGSSVAALTKIRVKDFGWPEFAAGCDSLFTPDQPFRFHELPFPARGITNEQLGGALTCDLIQNLSLPYTDDRFEGVLHPPVEARVLNQWLDEAEDRRGEWPGASPAVEADFAAANPPLPEESAAPAGPPAANLEEPPSSWQQAARAMYEGEQQVPREAPPVPRISALPPKHVVGVPVMPQPAPVVEAAPVTGLELARVPQSSPPAPYVPAQPPDQTHQQRSPANDEAGFEWRHEQPHHSPPPPPHGGSTVSVNTTIVVEGNGDGVVVESAIRVTLGGGAKKKKVDAVEKFADGDDIEESRVQMAPPEGLPEFSAMPAELRAVVQHIPPSEDSVQWPKFSVTPMRRRIAFGPLPSMTKGSFFGSPAAAASKPPLPEAKPLPPKKSVGFLFKKLTNS